MPVALVKMVDLVLMVWGLTYVSVEKTLLDSFVKYLLIILKTIATVVMQTELVHHFQSYGGMMVIESILH